MGTARIEQSSANANSRPNSAIRRQGGAYGNNPVQRQIDYGPHSGSDFCENGENVPKCRCGSLAVLRTVKKPGRNNGRKFYTCDRTPGQQCGFFQWDNQPTNEIGGLRNAIATSANGKVPITHAHANKSRLERDQSEEVRGQNSSLNLHSNQTVNARRDVVNLVKCSCNLDATERTVKKQGPNNGRKFFTCSKPWDERCRFFEWADEPSSKSAPGAPKRPLNTVIPDNDAPQRKKPNNAPGSNTEITMEEIDSFKMLLNSTFAPDLKRMIKQFEGIRIEKTQMLGTEAVLIPLDKLTAFEQYLATCCGMRVERKFNDQLITRIRQYLDKETKRQAADAITEPLDHVLPPLICEKLMQFQWEGVHFALRRGGRCLIGDDMGLGKTLQAITVARIYSKDWPLLVICPSSLRLNWKEELLNWLSDDLEEEDILVMMTGKDIDKPIRRVNIVSYDLVRKMSPRSLRKCQFIIADESHYLKSGTAKRTKAVVPLLKNARRALLLSGTPALSRPVELFCQINALAQTLFPDYHDYVQQYCNAHYGFFGYDVSGASNLQELNMLLRGSILIRRKKEDVLTQLPDKQRQVIWVQTTPKIMKDVKKALDKFQHASAAANGAQDENSAAQLRRAAQAAQNELYTLSGEAKIGAILEFCRDTSESGHKFIVFGHHGVVMDPVHDYLTRKLKLGVIRIDGKTPQQSRQDLCTKFQTDPQCKVALLSITAAGVGLTLTAAKVVLFAELYWNPGSLLQAEDRAHRIGQKDCVLVQYLLAKKTIDETMWDTVRKKLHVVGHSLTGAAARMEVGKEKTSDRERLGGIETFFKTQESRREMDFGDEVEEIFDGDSLTHQDADNLSGEASRTIPSVKKRFKSSIILPTRMDDLTEDGNGVVDLENHSELEHTASRGDLVRLDADRALAERLQAEFDREIY